MNSKKIVLFAVAFLFLISFVMFYVWETNPKSSNNISQQTNDEIQLCSNEESTFVNEMIFNYIKEVYSNIDFYSDFEIGNTELYGFYKEQYLKLINCEAPFVEKNSEKEYYINEFGEMDYTYDPNNYIYYFFDMDSDDIPELCISDETRFIYIMKYNSATDKFVLWHEISTTWNRLFGSKRIWFYSGTFPVKYAFYQLNDTGTIEYSIWFYLDQYTDSDNNIETTYMLTLPEFSNDSRKSEIPEKIKCQSIEIGSHFYYRISENQWNELTKNFFEGKEKSKEKIKEVSFTYSELKELLGKA